MRAYTVTPLSVHSLLPSVDGNMIFSFPASLIYSKLLPTVWTLPLEPEDKINSLLSTLLLVSHGMF